MKYFIATAFIVLTACKQQTKNPDTWRLEQARALVKKVGFQSLPFSYDMAKRNVDSRHPIDETSNDTLLFDSYGQVGGALPDTSAYFGFIYYKVGDSLIPFLVTVDKTGKVVDRQPIGIGSCGGLAIDVDSCVDMLTIHKNLALDLLYKVRGTAEAQTSDSTFQTVNICNTIIGKGQITKEGKIEIKRGDLQQCR